MAKKRIGELPSGSIRKKVYSHSEPCFDEHGKPIIDEKTEGTFCMFNAITPIANTIYKRAIKETNFSVTWPILLIPPKRIIANKTAKIIPIIRFTVFALSPDIIP